MGQAMSTNSFEEVKPEDLHFNQATWHADYGRALHPWHMSRDEEANMADAELTIGEFEIASKTDGWRDSITMDCRQVLYASSLGSIQRVITGFHHAVLVLVDQTDTLSAFEHRTVNYVATDGAEYEDGYGAALYSLRGTVALADLPDAGSMLNAPNSLDRLINPNFGDVTTPGEVRFGWVMFVSVPESDIGALEASLMNSSSCFYTINVELQETTEGWEQFRGDDVEVPIQDYVVQGSAQDILHICYSTGVPQDVRHRSMLLKLYPHIGPACLAHLKILDFDKAKEEWTVDATATLTTTTWTAATSLFTLGYCFTIEKNIRSQVHARMKAAGAASRCAHADEIAIRDLIQASQYQAGKQDSLTNQVLGWTVAVNSKFQIDPNVERANTAAVADMESKYKWNPWTSALYEQLRMVAEDLHATSLRFGYQALSVYPLIGPSITEQMKLDKETLTKANAKIADRPYTGCVKNLPSWARIRTQLSGVVFGLLYYEKGLDDKEKENWKLYAVKAIANKLAPQERRRVEIAVGLAPTPTHAEWSTLINKLSYMDAARMIEVLPSADRLAVERLLQTAEVSGPYITEVRKKEEVYVLNQVMAEVNNRLKAFFDTAQNSLNDLIGNSDDPIKRATLRDRKQALSDRMQRYLGQQRKDTRFQIHYNSADQEFNTRHIVESQTKLFEVTARQFAQIMAGEEPEADVPSNQQGL
jgi:hypothetical protein